MSESTLTDLQIQRWNVLVDVVKKELPTVQHFHLANSGGFKHASRIQATAGRTGIALYGIDPGNVGASLRPVLRIVTVVGEVHTVPVYEQIGYNGTFTTQRETTLAVVPVGYYEGIDRRLSNVGSFLINGTSAPIRGRVSMNMTLCDVTNIDDVQEGTDVVVLSDNPSHENSVAHVAELSGTIPYEILVHIPAQLRRVVVA